MMALVLTLAVALAPAGAGAQDHSHHHHHDHDASEGHTHHQGGPVECTSLAAPPWSGLSASDLQLIRELQEAIAGLDTPEAARQAGFRPAFGNIPTMGVHWIHQGRMARGFDPGEPDHLMFAPVNGEETLVGIAYAFIGPPDADIPASFESALAHWHDHPELGGSGQTLHMLHVWLVPSPYGPFAGNNFALPFMGHGITPPDACWIQSDEDVERLEVVGSAFALAEWATGGGGGEALEHLIGQGAAASEQGAGGRAAGAAALRMGERLASSLEEWGAALDLAAQDGDAEAWRAAADGLIEGLGPVQRQAVEALRLGVTGVQASSAGRDE
ncbi:MAG: hypothetical protein EA352_12105 [Gemmatimonadales bacterium]|nr:MAG: hypothetical protein EA352_12105 [Gemmatimonadales bacterium]